MYARALLASVAALLLVLGILPGAPAPVHSASQPPLLVWHGDHVHLHSTGDGVLLPDAADAGDPPTVGTFRCGTALLAEENRLVTQQLTYHPLTTTELQRMGRADGAGFVRQDTEGQQTQFWARRLDNGQFYQVSATLQRVTPHGYLYVDNLTSISASALNTLATEWEKMYTTLTGIFGDVPDVDGDPHVTILILDIKDGSTGGGYVAGYYDSRNQYPLTTSNLREMFYIDANPGVPGDAVSLYTLAHEFQHMINWNYHKEDSGQDTWLNEGLADLAGFLAGYGHDDNLALYLQDPNDSVINWNHTPKDYGSVYLLLLYIWERYGGNTTARNLLQHPGLSMDAVDAALQTFGTPDRFRAVFQKWTVANYLGDRQSAGGVFGYKNLTLVSSGENNRTTFRRAALTGSHTAFPANVTNTVQRWGVRYYTFGGATGNLILSVNGPDNSPFGASVVTSTTTGFTESTNTVSALSLNAGQDGTQYVAGFGGANKAALVALTSLEDGQSTVSFNVSALITAEAPPTATATPSATATASPTSSASPTVTATPTGSVSPTPTVSVTPTGSVTPSATPITGTPTVTVTAIATPSLPITVAPTLGGPSDGTVLPALSASLAWVNPTGVTQYHLQVLPVNNDGPGLNLIRNAESQFTVPAPVLGQGPYVLLPGMSYQWRVRVTSKPTFAPEDDLAWGPWSVFKRFKTPPPNSGGIVPLDPPNGATVPSGSVVLRWTDVSLGVFYYEVQVSGDTRFDVDPATATSFVWWNLVHGGATSPLNSWHTPSLSPTTTYFWRVRPRVQGDGTPVAWSPIYSFKTGP